ncbi:hypothetical protein [Corynebacterium sp. AOP12-C2-36]|uniref:hypothetical protein n=1 Tax=Corynebacterium sp. AOP12-C2-36 TaxID=3457723 RepID=UPI004034627A
MNIPQAPLSPELPTVLTTPVLARLVGLSQPTLRQAARSGGLDFGGQTVRAIQTATRILWPAQPIIDALGLDEDAAAAHIDRAQRAVEGSNRARVERYGRYERKGRAAA